MRMIADPASFDQREAMFRCPRKVALHCIGASLLLGTWLSTTSADADGWAAIVMEELRRGAPMPVLSAYGAGLDVQTAYGIQRIIVEEALKSREIGGYKAGFTAAAPRKKFKLQEPIAGVLFADGLLGDGAEVRRNAYKRLMVEVEIGFVLRSPITRHMNSISDLKTYVSHAVPAIELPDLNYEDIEKLNGLDVLATNMAAAAYLVGEPFRLTDLAEVNALEVALYRDGELIDQGHAQNALGNQLRALQWLVNTLIEQGWPLRPGQVLLTGTLGKINPGIAGSYYANFGRGELRFNIVGGNGVKSSLYTSARDTP